MSKKQYTSVIDVPKPASEDDLLGIDKYKKGLVRFIENTQTPITVAIQGEWGSGKTSLMNTLKDDLCDQEGKRFIPIWLNTWQYSLMKEPNESLVSIIKGLTDEVLAIVDDGKSEIAQKVRNVFGNILKASTKLAVSATTGQDISGVMDAMSTSKELTILDLRNALNDAINSILEKEKKDGFIFFIDDLDRIDPPMAVQILELLKNIFDLSNCVFVLAIDYDVVIKGLEPKFGKFTEKNEREFRSFFDKIIQLPFSMPTATYDINEFLVKSLFSINYISKEQSEDDEFTSTLSDITRLSVGSNPRSLKRLLNSLSLINCINFEEEDENSDNEISTIISYALVNIQIAYPPIYSLLVKEPNFITWGEKIAMQLNLPQLDETVQAKLNDQEEFDEDWEKILFRVCDRDLFLKKRALSISQLFNKIKVLVPETMSLSDLIDSSISMSAVTSVEAFDKPVVALNKAVFLRNFVNKVLPHLQNKLKDAGVDVLCKQKRFQANAELCFKKGGIDFNVVFTPNADSKGIKLSLFGERSIAMSTEKTLVEDITKNDLTDWYNNFISTQTEIINNNKLFTSAGAPNDLTRVFKKRRVVQQKYITYVKSIDDLNSVEILDSICSVATSTFELLENIAANHKVTNF